MGLYNTFVEGDIKEEAARRQALIDKMNVEEEEFSKKLEELSIELFNKPLAELSSDESAKVLQAYTEWQEEEDEN